MAFDVTIQPSGHRFEVDDDERILEAALRQGFAFPYGCRNGACGSCKGRVLSGEVDHGPRKPPGITEAEITDGYALFCQAVALDDLEIEIREIGAAKNIVVKTLPCRVASLEKVAPDVMIVRLQLPATEKLAFLPGQYLDILLRDGSRRSYSIASTADDALIEIHVRHLPGGAFSERVFSALKEKDLLRFEGPLGRFFIDEESVRPRIFVAGGTGFGPIQGMIDALADKGALASDTLVWGARDEVGFYRKAWLEQRVADGLRFIPVVSDAPATFELVGVPATAGYPADALLAQQPNLEAFDVYMAGPPPMIESCRKAFLAAGLPDDRLFYDSFAPAAD
ncbi:MAG: 2Fe-2S iron-sulfur cluster-binding protein [Thioalkalivibrionaceae bacterium]